MLRALALFLLVTGPARACDVALLLSIDISGSIDAGEYAIQTGGLALALRDPAIADALVEGEVALAVVQWSGVGRQALVMPWRRMTSYAEVSGLAARIEMQARAFTASDTAVGEAVDFSAKQFTSVPDCRRKVIDMSGDGPENAGYTLGPARARAIELGIEINAIAIEDAGKSAPMTAYFRRSLITSGGFVLTARGLQDYPRAIREKLLREVSKVVG